MLSEQIQPSTFEFDLDHLVDHELNLDALDARFNNDETGANAYDPRVMLRIVLLAYSRGLISSRRNEHACLRHVQFIALSGDSQPSYTHIAKFVRELGPQIKALFNEVLRTCDRMGLIGRQVFAIDGVKLPTNASEGRSGTHAELLHWTQPSSQRVSAVEPVFGNIRHNRRLNRFTLRGKAKVNAQWSLYCLVHNIEKLANYGYAQ